MKENICFFYKSSIGELHVGLPLLKKIKDYDKSIKIYFFFAKKQIYENLPAEYKKIIHEIGRVIFSRKESAVFIIRNYFAKNYLFTCLSGHTGLTRLFVN